MTLIESLEAALGERKARMEQCPVKIKPDGFFADKPCPKCRATSAGPCWLNVEADAAFVDAVKEIAALHAGPEIPA